MTRKKGIIKALLVSALVFAGACVVQDAEAHHPTRPTIVIAPPAVRVEVISPRPTVHHVWRHGYWRWTATHGYVWVRGVWVHAPEHRWVPGHWHRDVHGYWFFRHGHWTRR